MRLISPSKAGSAASVSAANVSLSCTFGVRLLGTLVDEDRPNFSLASIHDPALQSTFTYRAGDRGPGAPAIL